MDGQQDSGWGFVCRDANHLAQDGTFPLASLSTEQLCGISSMRIAEAGTQQAATSATIGRLQSRAGGEMPDQWLAGLAPRSLQKPDRLCGLNHWADWPNLGAEWRSDSAVTGDAALHRALIASDRLPSPPKEKQHAIHHQPQPQRTTTKQATKAGISCNHHRAEACEYPRQRVHAFARPPFSSS